MKPVVKTLCLVVLLFCVGLCPAQAGWIPNGVPLTHQWGAAGGGVMTSDLSGGAIVAYQACHEGVGRIMVQHVNDIGVLLWGQDGVEICAAEGDEQNPQIVSDGAGGAIVTWGDYRSGNLDIYARRVDASGALLWPADGVSLCTAAGDQHYPQITSDGAGGAIVAWYDSRSGDWDVYAQRVNDSGAIQWTVNGVLLCASTGEEYPPQITSDGAGGAIVTWDDSHSGDWDVYAQRVTASGTIPWAADGVPICTAAGGQYSPQITFDAAGGAIITWYDYRSENSDIYAQRVNDSGAIQWTTDGISLCEAAGDQYSPQITFDGAGGAIVTWQDTRTGSFDIYAQRLNQSGAILWTTNGVPVCTATGDQWNPGITRDGVGGAIFTWGDYRNGNSDIYAQRVNASGTVQWTANGVSVCTATGAQSFLQITQDGVNGAIVTWYDSRSGNSDIYAQRVNASGTVQWTANGVLLCTATGAQYAPQISSSGAGGAIVTWEDWRSGTLDIYAQRVNASGAIQWTANGRTLCTAIGDQSSPQITSDGAGGAVATWWDGRSGNWDIYAQRVSASGTVQWTANGVPLCTETADQAYPQITSDGTGGAIVTWEDPRSGNWDIYAQRVNASGTVQWTTNGIPLCTATGDQHNLEIISDNAGGAIVTWEDFRSGNEDIFAQRVSASGTVQWRVNGVPLCTATGDQMYPQIASDGAGGAIVTWEDSRSVNGDIYAQRVNASGAIQWAANGVLLCADTGNQHSLQITSDGAGGAIVTWYDSRSGSWNAYVQRVNTSGAIQWAADGVPICTAAGTKQFPQITSDGAGGAVVTWHDSRGGWSIYAQRVNALGAIQWTADGVPLCTGTGYQYSPRITSDGAHGALVAWTDQRCGSLSYATRVFAVNTGHETDMPLAVALFPNHPNPFNPQTTIGFYLPEAQEIVLEVYDVAGERVARLAEGMREKGYQEVTWDGRSSSGADCSSGVYFSRLTAESWSISRKMVMIR